MLRLGPLAARCVGLRIVPAPFDDVPDDAAPGLGADASLDLAYAQIRCSRQFFDLRDDPRRRSRSTQMLPMGLCRFHPGRGALTDQRGLQLRHGTDEREHRIAHGRGGVRAWGQISYCTPWNRCLGFCWQMVVPGDVIPGIF